MSYVVRARVGSGDCNKGLNWGGGWKAGKWREGSLRPRQGGSRPSRPPAGRSSSVARPPGGPASAAPPQDSPEQPYGNVTLLSSAQLCSAVIPSLMTLHRARSPGSAPGSRVFLLFVPGCSPQWPETLERSALSCLFPKIKIQKKSLGRCIWYLELVKMSCIMHVFVFSCTRMPIFEECFGNTYIYIHKFICMYA